MEASKTFGLVFKTATLLFHDGEFVINAIQVLLAKLELVCLILFIFDRDKPTEKASLQLIY